MAPGLTTLDWVVFAAFFCVVGGVAIYPSRGQKNTRDYFLGGRSLPWWAATLSIIATETSAVSFIGLPALGYAGDWSYIQLTLGYLVGRVFLALFFVRAFYADDYETVYGYLGYRFGTGARTLAALLFLFGRIAASGVRLLAGCVALALAFETAGDIGGSVDPVIATVVLVGIGGTLLTVAGGIRAVIWTDVLLGLTFLASCLLAIGYLLIELDSSAAASNPAVTALTMESFLERISVFSFNLDLSDAKSFLAGLLGGAFLTVATHGTDQDIAQRILTCKDDRSGSLSVIASGVLIIPLFALFLTVGTLVALYYEAFPPQYTLPENKNHIFPTFFLRELPPGISGFMTAGLVAAALSSLTSVLNALAATTITDFYRPLQRLRGLRVQEDRHFLTASRVATVIWGALLIAAACAFHGGEESVVELALRVLTYVYGGLLGAFLVGLLTRRGSSLTVSIGMLLSAFVVLVFRLRALLDGSATSAPPIEQSLLEVVPAGVTELIRDYVPNLAWPYWTVVGTFVSALVGLLGSRPFPNRFR